MNDNKTLNTIIIISVILIIGLSFFLGYQFIKINRSHSASEAQTPNAQTSESRTQSTPIPSTTPAPETGLFFATVDRVEGSQVHLTLVNPPEKISSQSTITKGKLTNPTTYFGAITDIFIPTQHFKKQPSVSDILQVYGVPSHEGLAFTITKINLIK